MRPIKRLSRETFRVLIVWAHLQPGIITSEVCNCKNVSLIPGLVERLQGSFCRSSDQHMFKLCYKQQKCLLICENLNSLLQNLYVITAPSIICSRAFVAKLFHNILKKADNTALSNVKHTWFPLASFVRLKTGRVPVITRPSSYCNGKVTGTYRETGI